MATAYLEGDAIAAVLQHDLQPSQKAFEDGAKREAILEQRCSPLFVDDVDLSPLKGALARPIDVPVDPSISGRPYLAEHTAANIAIDAIGEQQRERELSDEHADLLLAIGHLTDLTALRSLRRAAEAMVKGAEVRWAIGRDPERLRREVPERIIDLPST